MIWPVIDTASNLKPTTSPTQQHTLSLGFRLQLADAPKSFRNSEQHQLLPQMSRSRLPEKKKKKQQNGQTRHTSAIRRHQFWPKQPIFVVFQLWDGCDSPNQSSISKNKQTCGNVKERTACNTSDMGRRRLQTPSWPNGIWILTFWRIFPQNCHRKPESLHVGLSTPKTHFWKN